jgi:predicted transcriptional regulator
MDLLTVRRSKLEINVDILKVLANHGPLGLTHIMYKVNISCTFLKPYLDLLIQRNLVEERTSDEKSNKTRSVYLITDKGMTVLSHFRELSNALPIHSSKIHTRAIHHRRRF